MLFDTHTHLDNEAFASDREQVIAEAMRSGVTRMINIGFNRETILTTMALVEQVEFIYAAVGWHPTDAHTMQPADIDWIAKLTKHHKVVAIGEIGLDYYWDTSAKDIQKRVLCQQIDLARALKIPIVIHNREAHEDIVRMLGREKAAEIGGVMHSFSGCWDTAKMCLDMGFYLSFGGPITFKNAKQLKEVLVQVPNDRLLLETDCPYLTPHPFRGKRNKPAHLCLIAETVAQLKGMEFEELCEITTRNAMTCFDIQ